jgi:8-oxo-dGTP pyrophosphatase MutT (NUDIX family)
MSELGLELFDLSRALIPSGIADPAEDLAAAAAREALKESGWEPQGLRPLIRLEAASGLTDSVNHIFWSRRALHRGARRLRSRAHRLDPA